AKLKSSLNRLYIFLLKNKVASLKAFKCPLSIKSKVLKQRLEYLKDHFTYNLYCNVCRSLFEKDKLLFSFLLCCNLLLEAFIKNPEDFKLIYDSKEPYSIALPAPWGEKLTDLQKMIIFRCLRPDKMVPAVTEFVTRNLGKKFVQPPAFDLTKSFLHSNSTIPLVFVLSPGADPMASKIHRTLLHFMFQSISLGQGQGPIAAEMISTAMQNGSWVCLQNCHLAVSWMSNLEKICEDFSLTTCHQDFRLWLTSYPSPKLPVGILQNGVKITNERPTGLRLNLLQSYLTDPKLLFGLCFFHGLVQERKKFGPLGWNIPYGFNDSDLHISMRQLQQFVNEYDQVPFKAITYLTGECNYGGRVTDDWDRRLLMTTLADFYCEDIIKTFLTQCNDFFVCQNLPISQQPEVFGLHENADISKDLQQTKLLFDSLLLTQGGGAKGRVRSGDDNTLYDIANNILTQVRNNTICVSLQNLLKAIKGLVEMDSELEAVAGNLLVGKVPDKWAKFSYPSLKPLNSYITDLLARFKFLQVWYENGQPKVFWLSGFFFPQAFLTGVVQNFARNQKIPIDLLTLDFESETPPKYGVYINGLFLDGARWDKERYAFLFFLCKTVEKKNIIQTDSLYVCPLYKTSERKGTLSTTGHSTNFVIAMMLSTKKRPQHWIKRGVAMLLQLDD
uniref:Uncharacterized protein n=1 Tax=Oryzias latipes TaxID=8090 RepID=A0A3P9JWJ4_ORYLA